MENKLNYATENLKIYMIQKLSEESFSLGLEN